MNPKMAIIFTFTTVEVLHFKFNREIRKYIFKTRIFGCTEQSLMFAFKWQI